MRFNSGPLIRLVESRSFAVILIIISLTMTIVGGKLSPLPVISRSFLGLPSPGTWITSPTLSLILGIGCELLAAAGILILIRAFNLMRGLRNAGLMMTALFMMMEGVSPTAGYFDGGSILLLVAILSVTAFYSIYQRSDGNRRIFLVFFLLGAGCLVEYGFIAYIPVMILACMQMRVMSLRAVTAILAGLLVPSWILWGFGMITFDTLTVPAFVNLFAPATLSRAIAITVGVAVTILAGASAGFLDMVHVYARNAMTRARFGIFAVTGLATVALSIIDFGNIEFYSPLLNLTTAYFLTLLFSFRQRGRLGAATVIISVMTLIFVALYVWKLLAVLA